MFIKHLVAAALALAASLSFAAADVNKASQAELESIKGIGPAVSQRMLDERAKKPFADWGDMETRVKGVGPGNAAKFSAAGLTVNGSAYTPTAAVAKAPKAKAEANGAKAARPAKPETAAKPVKS